MFDVFYYGSKPNLFGFEKYAASLEEAQSASKTEYFWYIYGDNDYTNFDFDFVPPSWEWNHKFIWPSKWQEDGRTVLACKWEIGPDHYMYNQQVGSQAKLDVFVIDTFNKANDASYNSIRTQGRTVRLRSTNNVVDTLKRCCKKAETDFIWVVSSDYNYRDFDFSWHPDPWQLNFVHVFGSKWQKWSNVFYINVNEFMRLTEWYTDIKNFPELNFVENQRVSLFDDNREIWWVDHSNVSSKEFHKDCKKVRFFDSYLDTIKRIVTRTDQEYVWVTSSLCDYKDFDFGWEPEPWQQDMLHVFPSNDQKFGDTFYVPVEKFKQQMDTLEILDWFDTVNFVQDQTVYKPYPMIHFYKGSLIDAIKQTTFFEPYIGFKHVTTQGSELVTPNMWRKKDRVIHTFNNGSACLVPKDAKPAIKSQIYDYDYILYQNSDNIVEKPQDIVFISYDEKNMEENWEIIKDRFPRTKRVHGVEGMENALAEAARQSDTDWVYCVFAKTRLHEDFEFDFIPDYGQGDKHYIFNCLNTMNGLNYGHMGIILYNKNLVLSNYDFEKFGLDYTLSFKHESVNQTSCYGVFNTSPFETWRAAFRECLKLRKMLDESPDIDTEYRLGVWTTKAQGDYAEYCINGANDGVKYYLDNKNNWEALKKSFRWDWLREYFDSLYS